MLLYDGLCRFCDGTVQFILKHDRRGTLRFATLQGDFARDVIARHPEVAGVDSLVLVEPDLDSGRERVYVRSEGALRIARYLGGAWRTFPGRTRAAGTRRSPSSSHSDRDAEYTHRVGSRRRAARVERQISRC